MSYPLPPRTTNGNNGNNSKSRIPDWIPFATRELVVKPRRTGYRHRPIIVVHDGRGTLEDGTPVDSLPLFARDAEPHLWVTSDPSALLGALCDHFREDPAWNYQLVQSMDDSPKLGVTRLARFGYRPQGKRHQAMHLVWHPPDMARDTTHLRLPNTTADLLRFALDIRDWLRDHDLPITPTFTGIAAALLRDRRFYPHNRGRVPGATNDKVRSYLPGVCNQAYTSPGSHFRQVVALDQHRAYHKAAQEIALPDSTTLYARGHFSDPEHAPVWLHPHEPEFTTALAMPGLHCVRLVSRRTHKGEPRPPALDFTGERRVYLWSSELDIVGSCDARITGLIASWSSNGVDNGMAHYGRFAEVAIDQATPYRQRWLKPTLHTAYGLLGAHRRGFKTGWRTARGERTTWLLGPREVRVAQLTFHATYPATANVVALGVLQAAIRARTITMARELVRAGMEVTHIHADGLHAIGDLPLIDTTHWRVEERNHLTYWDNVSWTSQEGDILPGRDTRKRVESYRFHSRVLSTATQPARTT